VRVERQVVVRGGVGHGAREETFVTRVSRNDVSAMSAGCRDASEEVEVSGEASMFVHGR
jgi:hypothetical protein